MRSTGLLFRRTAAQFGLLLALLSSVAVTTGVAVGSASAVRHSEAAGVEAALAVSVPTDGAYRFSFTAADDLATQSANAAEVFDRALTGIPTQVYSEVVSAPLAVTRNEVPLPASQPLVVVMTSPLFGTETVLASGEWPADAAVGQPIQGAVSSTTAAHLAMEIGDTLRLGDGGAAVQLVGTWAPLQSPAWVGPTGGFSAGHPGVAVLALLVPTSAVMELAGDATSHWTVVPDASAIGALGLDRLIAASGPLKRELAESVADGQVTFEGWLSLTAERFREARDTAQAVVPVGTSLALLIGAATIIQLARLLVVSRMPETVLLRSRGASSWLTIANTVEALIVAVLGAAAGLVVALWSVDLTPGALTIAFAVAVGTVVIMSVVARNNRTGGARRVDVHRSGRLGSTALFGTAALLIPLAALALGQFLEYGSPLVRDSTGRNSVDVVLAMAPALGIIAAVVVLVALAQFTSRGIATIAARTRRLQPALSARQLSRRFPQYAGAILVIGLAVSGVTLASAYSATEGRLSASSAELRNGAAVRVLEPVDDASGLVPLAATASTPALTTDVVVGSRADDATLVALPAGGIRSVMTTSNGAIDTDALSRLLEVAQPPSPTLPPEATELSYRVSVDGRAPRTEADVTAASASVTTTVWLEDAAGRVRALPSPAIPCR